MRNPCLKNNFWKTLELHVLWFNRKPPSRHHCQPGTCVARGAREVRCPPRGLKFASVFGVEECPLGTRRRLPVGGSLVAGNGRRSRLSGEGLRVTPGDVPCSLTQLAAGLLRAPTSGLKAPSLVTPRRTRVPRVCSPWELRPPEAASASRPDDGRRRRKQRKLCTRVRDRPGAG